MKKKIFFRSIFIDDNPIFEKIGMYRKTQFFLSFLMVKPDPKNIYPIKSYEIFPILTPLLNHCGMRGRKILIVRFIEGSSIVVVGQIVAYVHQKQK